MLLVALDGVQPMDIVLKVLSALGGVAVLAGAVAFVIGRIVYLHHFTSKTPDRLWESFCEVHEQRFPDEEVRDSCADIRDWIDLWSQSKGTPSHKMEEILIARCIGIPSRVRSYIYAQYYYDYKFVFVSYIATDRRARGAYRVDMRKLLAALLRIVQKYDRDWKAIIGELEEIRFSSNEGRTHTDHHAYKLFRLFLDTSNFLRQKKRIDFPVYFFMFPYYQPVLRPDDAKRFNERNMIDLSQQLKQWLLYIPNGSRVIKKGDNIYVEKERAVEVLEFIFNDLYPDAFPGPVYQQYLRRAFAYHVNQLGPEVRLARTAAEAAFGDEGGTPTTMSDDANAR